MRLGYGMRPMTYQTYENLFSLNWKLFLLRGSIFQIPYTNELILGYGKNINPKQDEVYFFNRGFYGNWDQNYYPEFIIETTIDEFSAAIEEYKNINKCINFQKLKPLKTYEEEFIEDVKDMLIDIQNSKTELRKLVAVTKFDFEKYDSVHPLLSLKSIRPYENGFLYGYWQKGRGEIGFSPEPLVYQSNDYWCTKALAGTISTEIKNYERVILSNKKEVYEHELVVSDIEEKLETLGKKISKSKLHCMDFGKIAHLQTLLRFPKGEEKIETLIDSLSPTAALGGYPQNEVFPKLKKLHYYNFDEANRSHGGVFGFSSDKFSGSLVKIRNFEWKNNILSIHSGCGIVEASIPENELLEIHHKKNTIRDLIHAEYI